MKRKFAILFLFLSSFCLTSCHTTDEEIVNAGYDFINLPTEVTEDFELVSLYKWCRLYEIHFYYVSHNTDNIKIDSWKALVTRSEQDVDVEIECRINYTPANRFKFFTVRVLGLENDLSSKIIV